MLVKSGVLVHVYYLEAGWEALVWGDPAKGIMGTLPKLVQLMLSESPEEPITDIVMYTGPSRRDGLNEGEYGKKFLLDRFEQLSQFPQLKSQLALLTDAQRHNLSDKLAKAIHTKEQLVNSADEVVNAAKFFHELGITKVFQIAAASHAPRCIQLQTIVRFKGLIPPEQFWFTIAADTTYANTTPSDVVVAEPPHRGDDPALGIHPSITDILKQYYSLPYEARQPFLRAIESALDGLPEYQ